MIKTLKEMLREGKKAYVTLRDKKINYVWVERIFKENKVDFVIFGIDIDGYSGGYMTVAVSDIFSIKILS